MSMDEKIAKQILWTVTVEYDNYYGAGMLRHESISVLAADVTTAAAIALEWAKSAHEQKKHHRILDVKLKERVVWYTQEI
jgi:hypothetical protein